MVGLPLLKCTHLSHQFSPHPLLFLRTDHSVEYISPEEALQVFLIILHTLKLISYQNMWKDVVKLLRC